MILYYIVLLSLADVSSLTVSIQRNKLYSASRQVQDYTQPFYHIAPADTSDSSGLVEGSGRGLDHGGFNLCPDVKDQVVPPSYKREKKKKKKHKHSQGIIYLV